MKTFSEREVEEAIAHAAAGGQALHLHRVIVDRDKAPKCFVRAVDKGEWIAHLFEQRPEPVQPEPALVVHHLEPLSVPDVVSRFRRWHADNPHVYDLFKRFAADAKSSGRERWSARDILHRIRWYMCIETKSADFKINDVASAFYARMLVKENPDYEGFFEMRRAAADEQGAA